MEAARGSLTCSWLTYHLTVFAKFQVQSHLAVTSMMKSGILTTAVSGDVHWPTMRHFFPYRQPMNCFKQRFPKTWKLFQLFLWGIKLEKGWSRLSLIKFGPSGWVWWRPSQSSYFIEIDILENLPSKDYEPYVLMCFLLETGVIFHIQALR